MKLLIITQYFPPEMGAPQARLYELATRLKKIGHSITVLTAMPNYPTGRIFDAYRGKIRKTEILDGLRVIRTFLYPSNSGRSLPRLFSYLSFAFSTLLFGIWKLGRHDVILIESPPLFIMPSALLISKIVRGKAVMMVSDIWPDLIIRMGYQTAGLGIKLMLWLEKFSYNHCVAVALTNPGAGEQIKNRFSHLKKVTVISNGVDTTFFRPDLRNQQVRAELGADENTFLVGYCGLHGLAQGLEVILNAAVLLREHKNIKFVMIGDGPKKQELVQEAERKQLSNLTFFPHRPKLQMPAVLASLDVSLVPLITRLPGTMPSKVYEALAAGAVPIVAKGCEGDTLVSKFMAGCCYEPGSAVEMAAEIRKLAIDPELYQQIRSNGMALSQRFDRAKIAVQTEAILAAIATDKPLPKVEW